MASAAIPRCAREHIHPLAADLPLRANPHSVGDGLRLGLSVGAAFGPPDAGFYGHLIPSKVAYNNPYEFTDLTFYHSEHGVLLNLEGRRFCDETIGDHLNTLYVLDQPEARALLVYDQRVHDEWMMAPYVEGVEPLDKFQLAYRRGARAAVADDIEEFEALPDEWGYPGPAARDTLLEFNRQCEAGAPSPGRKLDAAPLVDPPYYVIEVIPAITFTFSGLRIDPQARVLDESGHVIPGLLAAGADAGGVFQPRVRRRPRVRPGLRVCRQPRRRPPSAPPRRRSRRWGPPPCDPGRRWGSSCASRISAPGPAGCTSSPSAPSRRESTT